LQAWTLALGDAADVPLHELLLDNPVLERPILQVGGQFYLWILASTFNHSAFSMLERLLAADAALWDVYFDRRAEYLEERVAAELQSQVRDRARYHEPSLDRFGRGEAVRDGCARPRRQPRPNRRMQGGSAFAQGRRKGRGAGCANDVEELVVEPARQAKTVCGLPCSANRRGSTSQPVTAREVMIEASEIRAAVTVTTNPRAVSPGLLPGIRDLVEAGLNGRRADDSHEFHDAFSICLSRSTSLSTPARFFTTSRVDQRSRRTNFSSARSWISSGCILRTGFQFGRGPSLRSSHSACGSSGSQTRSTRTTTASKPSWRLRSPRLVGRTGGQTFCRRSRCVGGPRWTELGLALCSVAYEEQKKFEDTFVQLQDEIRDGTRAANEFVLFANGPEERRHYFIGPRR